MSKATQAVVSQKNPFWIPKNRYYELKYFCLQFWDWQKRRAQLDGLATRENRVPTEWEAIERAELDAHIQMVMNCAYKATSNYTNEESINSDLYDRLLYGVTKGLSYDTMNVRKTMPIGREAYYAVYRKFFWFLNSKRK